jgi:metal-sulfur cluster biosynthetic enzyme
VSAGPGSSSALRRRVLAALDLVRDPELDRPITELGFVAACTVSAQGDAVVLLRLPTYFCAPNFAFLMASDARRAVLATEGVRGAEIMLEDHFAASEINSGVAAGAGFAATFPGLAEGELDGLRAAFGRKAVLAATDEAVRPLAAAGWRPADLAGMTLNDAAAAVSRSAAHDRSEAMAALTRLRERRAELGLPAGGTAPLLVDPVTGAAVDAAVAPRHLRRAAVTRVGMEANTSICRGMLRGRYREGA